MAKVIEQLEQRILILKQMKRDCILEGRSTLAVEAKIEAYEVSINLIRKELGGRRVCHNS
jgi:hypothetical protein